MAGRQPNHHLQSKIQKEIQTYVYIWSNVQIHQLNTFFFCNNNNFHCFISNFYTTIRAARHSPCTTQSSGLETAIRIIHEKTLQIPITGDHLIRQCYKFSSIKFIVSWNYIHIFWEIFKFLTLLPHGPNTDWPFWSCSIQFLPFHSARGRIREIGKMRSVLFFFNTS